jgi:hypothetical protein
VGRPKRGMQDSFSEDFYMPERARTSVNSPHAYFLSGIG